MITRSTDNKIVWRWDHGDPFGLTPPNDNPSATGIFTFNLRMPGQYYDKNTNLFYNYHRDYDPQTGRYIQSDPIGLDGGVNTYGYVGGNPLMYVDPFGQQGVLTVPEVLVVGGIILFAGTRIKAPHNSDPYAAANYGPKPERSIAQESQADLDRDHYKSICEQPPPPNLNPCEEAKYYRDRAKRCGDLRQDWDNKFWPGRHWEAIRNARRSYKTWEKEVLKKCTCP